MKFSTLLAGTSCALSAVLLAALLSHLSSSADPSTRAATAAKSVAAPTPPPPSPADTWTQLQTGDLAAQAARLKAEGFPPRVIRAIMTARIRAQFAARRKVIDAAMAASPYWEAKLDPKLELERRALEREERKALRDLLGPDPENGTAAQLQRTYPNLSPEKIAAFAALRDRYNEQTEDLYAANRGMVTPINEGKEAELTQAFRSGLKALLSPQEFEEYEMRESRTANQLHFTLSSVDVSEQEYRSIYQLQSAFDEQYSFKRFTPDSPEAKARTAAQQKLKDDIKLALGDQRYSEYERGTDGSYRNATQLVARLNLPPETAADIYTVQKDLQKRALDLRRNTALAPADRSAQLAALAEEAETKLTPKLGGPAGFDAYKTNGGGWLTMLKPRPPAK